MDFFSMPVHFFSVFIGGGHDEMSMPAIMMRAASMSDWRIPVMMGHAPHQPI
jgi:hypothetical protein